ncbi:unnamed protein product [Rhizoctonia solani]|uniref:DUF6534 domain-containing protein n=1 Tax=Rhizoctonia solani TaxID=456999 RepID=A0A8H3CST7_9AGAM|nr:unnamed protein product [Rhizoctonia solani]
MEADFDSTLGATYIGVTITACLYGISTLHVYTYWNRQKQDNTITRISIAILWLADTIKLICATHVGYRLLITEYENDPAALFYSTWSVNVTMKMELLLTCLVIFMAQVLSAYHARKSSKRINVSWATPRTIRLMGIIAVLFAFVQLSFGIMVSSLAWIHWDIREMDKQRWVASVWMGSATVSSIIITYALSALLTSTYVRVQSIIDIINELLRCFIHTGLLTSILSVVNLLAFSFMGQYIRIGVNFPLGTLNLITLLAILNTRSNEILGPTIPEEYECGVIGYKNELHGDVIQTSLQGSLRIGKRSFKLPSKLPGTGTSIKVFVQKETHIISIPENKFHHSDSMMH